MSPLKTYREGIGVAWRRRTDTISSGPNARSKSLETDVGEMPFGGGGRLADSPLCAWVWWRCLCSVLPHSPTSPAQIPRVSFSPQAPAHSIPPNFTDINLFSSFWHEHNISSLDFIHLKKIQPSTWFSINYILLPEL